ncbi:MAG: hypothetical protein AB7U81_09525 [Thiohalomonadaceae bacterium]
MAKFFSTCVAGLLAFALASTVLATEEQGDAGKDTKPAAAVYVTVLKVTALDAEDKERILYQDAAGMRLPLAELRYIGRRLQGEGVPAGVFHELRVELDDEVEVSIPGRETFRTRFGHDGAPTVLRLPGPVVLPKSGAHP